MKKTLNFAKPVLFALALSLVAFAGNIIAGVVPVPTPTLPPSWSPNITITGTLSIYTGDSTQLSAAWQTGSQIDSGPNVTRQSWTVNGSFVQNGGPDVDNNDGTSNYLFGNTYSNVPGTYTVCFRIWHHTQTLRDYSECVDVVVTDPPPPPTCDGPDAPAISNHYYNSLFAPTDRDEEKRLQIASQIAHRMDEETKAFDGIAKCVDGQPNPAYEAAVKAAVDAILAGGSFLSWFW